jgi:ergothioneine biosynthesis protein EgtB
MTATDWTTHGATATIRHGGRTALAAALADARARTLRLFGAYEAALPRGMEVPYAPELNPPRWEVGHVGWFEEYWIGRNPHRRRGVAADPDVARAASALAGADALYHSSKVAHTRRWHLELPDAARTRRYLATVRERTLALLADSEEADAPMYFYRLALAHEDMHAEAAVYMAQHLALPIAPALDATAPAAVADDGVVEFAPATATIGSAAGGFAFDNERAAHEVALGAFAIDRAPVSWQRFLPFVEAGGYDDPRWWTGDGWAWRQRASNGRPRYLQHDDGGWCRAVFGQWVELDPRQPAVNLSAHEAQAWCAWAGRRLPSEAEWEHAATSAAGAFEWGQVWEWTASPFAPYPGFEPHPYRDYSQPWFDGRPVLRGASFATAARMKHARYRNYFPAARNDIFAGFRSCAA